MGAGQGGPGRCRFVVVLMAGVRLWQAPGAQPLPPIPVGAPHLVVLPFDNLSGEEDQQFFAEGLHEEVLHRLAQIPRLRLISRTSASYFGGSGLSASAIADSLGADYVLEGSVRTGTDGILLTMQLIDASSDEHLWSEALRGERTLDGILELQRTLASRVAGALGDTFGQPNVDVPTRSLEAYTAYLRGIYHETRFTSGEWWAAIDEYERAVALDPDFGRAHARLAATLAIANNYGLRSQGELFPRIRHHSAEAMRLIPDEPAAHMAAMSVHWPIEWDWEAARTDMERALELDPDYVNAMWALAEWHGVIDGNTDRGLEMIRRAEQLDPYSGRLGIVRMWILMNGRRWEEAIVEGRAVMELDPANTNTALSLISCLALAGRTEEAKALLRPLLESTPTPRPISLATAAAWAGEEEVAREILRTAVELKVSGGSVPASGIAAAYAVLGEVEPAVEWLERSFRDEGGIYYLRHADWDNLALDLRFQALWQRVGLAGLHSSLASR